MEISPIELVLGLFVVAVTLAYVARRIGVAYPILLVLGGLVLGFVPGVPSIILDPNVIFLRILVSPAPSSRPQGSRPGARILISTSEAC
jgi:hypothetical protein